MDQIHNTLPYLFASEAARIIGVSEQTLRTWEHTGRLVPSRIPNGHVSVRVYQRAEIERIAAERRGAARR